MSDPVLDALRSAVRADPANHALRLHLAGLLLRATLPGEALVQTQAVLALRPTDAEALYLAAWAADDSGQPSLAAGYRALHDALLGEGSRAEGGAVPDRPAPTPEPVAVAAAAPPEPELGWEVHAPDLTLADVGGLESVKRRLQLALIAPLQNPELRALYGQSLRGGLLMYGPPGCGKTFVARALAGELRASFLSVGLSDVLDMWMGNSEKNVHALFQTARKKAPCVLFLDEIDALGRKRSQLQHGGANVINQLLMELDGVASDNEGVYVLAATNSPWDVDVALRRPGRLDRTVLVLPPDAPARQAILAHHLRGRPQAGLNLEALTARSEGYTGADLAHLVSSAAEYAIEDAIASGKARAISQQDFQKALRELKPSAAPWFQAARNVVLYANSDGSYDELREYMRARKLL